MSKLKVATSILAYRDVENSSAPKKKAIDWSSTAELDCESVYSDHFQLAGGGVKGVSDASGGVWALAGSIGTSVYPKDASLVMVSSTAFAVTPIATNEPHTVTANPDGTVTITRTSAFGSYIAGTRIGLKGPTEGGPFSDTNDGMWEVVKKTAANALVLRRVNATDSFGSETVTPGLGDVYLIGAPPDFGTKVYISGGASMGFGGVYDIVAQGDGFVVVREPNASTGISFTGDVGIAMDSLNYIRIEADQAVDVNVTIKGVEIAIPIFPIEPGVKPGWFEYRGPFGAVSVQNLTGETVNVSFVYGLEKAQG